MTNFVISLLLWMVLLPGSARGSGGGDHGHGHDEETVSFSVDDFARHGVTLLTAQSGVVDQGIELSAEVRPNADRLAHVAPRFAGIAANYSQQGLLI